MYVWLCLIVSQSVKIIFKDWIWNWSYLHIGVYIPLYHT